MIKHVNLKSLLKICVLIVHITLSVVIVVKNLKLELDLMITQLGGVEYVMMVVLKIKDWTLLNSTNYFNVIWLVEVCYLVISQIMVLKQNNKLKYVLVNLVIMSSRIWLIMETKCTITSINVLNPTKNVQHVEKYYII